VKEEHSIYNEQYEDWVRDREQFQDNRVSEAVAYTERENQNLRRHVERLEKLIKQQNIALEEALGFYARLSSFIGKESTTEKKIKAALQAQRTSEEAE
jgi:hypothetical protein